MRRSWCCGTRSRSCAVRSPTRSRTGLIAPLSPRWRGWRRGLSDGIGRAGGFYAVLVASIGLALAVPLAGISVVGMLVAASVIGGFGTPIGLVILVRLARDPSVMGPQPISRRLAIAGWAVAVIVGGFGLLAILGAAVGTF